MTYDYLIVGSGLTGATIARTLADSGQRVLVLERRSRLGGNVADQRHRSGLLVGLHGPHYFRTSSEQIWQFVNRFARFHEFKAIIKSKVLGNLENWPVAASCIKRLAGDEPAPTWNGAPANFEQAALSLMPRTIYELFVRGYTEKQWGVPARSLGANLCRRFDVRRDDNPYLTPNATYQAVPTDGYTVMVERMLSGIAVEHGFDYLRDRLTFQPRYLTIYTGPIDEYFGFALGKLGYRGQQRYHEYHPNVAWQQPCGQINYPDARDGAKIRTIEWKHMMLPSDAQRIRGTLITTETPHTPTDADGYEYPIPDQLNESLYQEYKRLAQQERNVLFCGRLGEYRYYDMDQAIGRAMMLAQRILTTHRAEAA